MFTDLDELSADAPGLVAAVDTLLLKGDIDQAMQEAVDAKAKFSSSGDAKGEAAACRAICRVSCANPAASQEALEAAESAVAAAKRAGSAAAEAAGTRQVANAYLLARKGEEALRAAEEAFGKSQSASSTTCEAASLVTLAKVNLSLNQYQKALELAEKAADRFKKVSEKTGEAVALHVVMDVCAAMKKTIQGVAAAEKMVEMMQSEDDLSQGVASVLSVEAYLANDDNTEAFTLSKAAAKVLKLVGASKRVARALQLGAEARAREASDEAIEMAERAQVMFQQSGDKYGQAGALITSANLYNILGEFDKASYRAEAGAETYRRLKASSEAAASLRTAALIFLDKKQYDPNAGKGVGKDALRNAKASKKLYEDVGDVKGAGYAGSLQTLAAALLACEEYSAAMEEAINSKELFDEMDHPVGSASALNTMAQVHHKKGDNFDAISAAKQAQQLFTEGNDEEGAEVSAYLIETFEASADKDKPKAAEEGEGEEVEKKEEKKAKPAAVKSVSGLGDLIPGNPAAVTILAAYEAYEGRAATAPGARRTVSGVKEGALEDSFQAPSATAAVFTLRWLPAKPKPESDVPPSKRSAKRLANKVVKMDMYTGEASAPMSLLPVVEAPGRKPRDLTALD